MSSTRPIVIHGGTVIDAATDRDGAFDILVEDGRVTAVEKPGVLKSHTDAERIDAKGQWVMPGCIDLHVHLREPGEEWKETIQTGAEAAVLGGFTSICCMPNTKPANDSAEVTRFILEKARAAGAARVLPIGAISMERKGKQLALTMGIRLLMQGLCAVRLSGASCLGCRSRVMKRIGASVVVAA
jgi:dihydroorotase